MKKWISVLSLIALCVLAVLIPDMHAKAAGGDVTINDGTTTETFAEGTARSDVSIGGGTADWDGSGALTLNGVTLTPGADKAIDIEDMACTITLVGTNNITYSGENGIYSNGALVINGDGNLNIKYIGNASTNSIYASTSISVDSTTITAECKNNSSAICYFFVTKWQNSSFVSLNNSNISFDFDGINTLYSSYTYDLTVTGGSFNVTCDNSACFFGFDCENLVLNGDATFNIASVTTVHIFYIYGTTIINGGTAIQNVAYGKLANDFDDGCTMNAGTLKLNLSHASDYSYAYYGDDFILNDGEFKTVISETSASDISVIYGYAVTINGGNFIVESDGSCNDIYTTYCCRTFEINDGTFKASNVNYGIYFDDDIVINGGTVDVTAAYPASNYSGKSFYFNGGECGLYSTSSGGAITSYSTGGTINIVIDPSVTDIYVGSTKSGMAPASASEVTDTVKCVYLGGAPSNPPAPTPSEPENVNYLDPLRQELSNLISLADAGTESSGDVANGNGTTGKLVVWTEGQALPLDIMQQIKNSDVTLEFKYTYEGVDYDIFINKYNVPEEEVEWYGPLYLAGLYYLQPAPVGGKYTIVSGDTLGAIAAKFNTTVEHILQCNPFITDRDVIKPGQILNF